MESISQRRGLHTRKATIDAEGIAISAAAPFSKQSWRVPFEMVMANPVEFTEQRFGLPIMESIFLALGLVFAFVGIRTDDLNGQTGSIAYGVVCIAIAGFVALWKRWPRRQLLQLSEGDVALVLFYDTGHRAVADEFAKVLAAAAADYMRRSYGAASPYESKAMQVERLESLLGRRAISQAEFDALKGEIVSSARGETGRGQYL